jgi:hypothetical protein
VVGEDGKAGSVFASNSQETLLPVTLGGNKVCKGLNDGLLGMKKKGKRIIVIPPQFGARYLSDRVPSESTIVYQVITIFNIDHFHPQSRTGPKGCNEVLMKLTENKNIRLIWRRLNMLKKLKKK